MAAMIDRPFETLTFQEQLARDPLRAYEIRCEMQQARIEELGLRLLAVENQLEECRRRRLVRNRGHVTEFDAIPDPHEDPTGEITF